MRLLHKLFYRTAEKNADWYRKYEGLEMGDNCKIFPGACVGSEPYLIKMGDNVEITDGVRLVTHDGGIKVATQLGLCHDADLVEKISIGSNVFIGVNSVVLPGVHIGSNVIVGAGSIVTRDIPDNSVVCGVPAKVVCSIEEYYQKNRFRIFETDSLSYNEKKDFYKKVYYSE